MSARLLWVAGFVGASVAGPGCGSGGSDASDAGAPDAHETPCVFETVDGFESGEDTRGFLFALPESYSADTSWPLVFIWHSADHDAEEWLVNFGWCVLARRAGFIVVAPRPRGDLITVWDSLDEDVETNIDVRFFDDLLAHMTATYSVDAERVYTTGMSAGALVSALLGMVRADVLGAFAPASGGLLVDWVPPAAHPSALVIWGGVEDQVVVHFDDLAREMIAQYRKNDQFVVACNHEMGHRWPRGTETYVWRFFQDHPRAVTPEPYIDSLPEEFPEYCSISP